MKIKVDKNIVELHPDSPQETADLEVLWRVIVDCMKFNKKLVPIGEFVPSKENLARFQIEGVDGGKTVWTENTANEDNTYYCAICNKYMKVAKGERVPLCCGGEMETLD